MEKYGKIKKIVYSSMELNRIINYEGKSFGSFGELLQGQKSDKEFFLVTLPIDLWSTCCLNVKKTNEALIINCDLPKTKRVVELIVKKFNISTGYTITVTITRNIPIGKGLSSSTADMLSTLRALEKFVGYKFENLEISNIFKTIEPHDALMYDTCVFYDQRQGLLLRKFDYIPQFKIIAIDFGGEVDTVEFNKKLIIPDELLSSYNNLYLKCSDAFNEKNDKLIAECATESLLLYLIHTAHSGRQLIYDNHEMFNSLGIINTHSGTCVGLIYPSSFSDEDLLLIQQKIEKEFKFSTFIVGLIN